MMMPAVSNPATDQRERRRHPGEDDDGGNHDADDAFADDQSRREQYARAASCLPDCGVRSARRSKIQPTIVPTTIMSVLAVGR